MKWVENLETSVNLKREFTDISMELKEVKVKSKEKLKREVKERIFCEEREKVTKCLLK